MRSRRSCSATRPPPPPRRPKLAPAPLPWRPRPPRRSRPGPAARYRRTCRRSTGRSAAPDETPGAYSTRTSPALARIPSSTVTVSSRSWSKNQGPRSPAGNRQAARWPRWNAGTRRRAAVAPLRSEQETADRSAATLAVTRWSGSARMAAAPRLVDERILEEPHADLGFEHPADRVVQRDGVDLALGQRVGQGLGKAAAAELGVPPCRVPRGSARTASPGRHG